MLGGDGRTGKKKSNRTQEEMECEQNETRQNKGRRMTEGEKEKGQGKTRGKGQRVRMTRRSCAALRSSDRSTTAILLIGACAEADQEETLFMKETKGKRK